MLNPLLREIFSYESNPIFGFERRRISWLRDRASLTRFATKVWGVSAVIVFAIWLISVFATGNDTTFQDGLMLFLIVLSLIVMVVVDLYSTFTVTINLSRQIHSDEWELIVISRQVHWNIFQAQYGIAQIRAWRPMVADIAFRIAPAELLFLEILRSLGTIVCLPVMAIPGLILAGYIIEPLWRMEAFTALSLAVSSAVKNTSVAYLALFGIALVIHVIQIAALAAIWYYFAGPTSNDEYGLGLLLCAIPIDAILAVVLTYVLYRNLQKYSLKFAFKRMFAPTD